MRLGKVGWVWEEEKEDEVRKGWMSVRGKKEDEVWKGWMIVRGKERGWG